MSILTSIGHKAISIIKNIGILITLIIGILLVITAYCGYVDPEKSAKFAIIGMVFPVMLALNVVALLVWIIVRRWLVALLPIAFMAVCYSAVITFSPINISFSNEAPTDSSFTLLTYNVMNFEDLSNHKGDNSTLRYILDKNADFVVLQEGSAKIKMDKLDIIQSLMPELKNKYPYRETRMRDIVILSKHPFTLDNEKILSNYHLHATSYKVNIKGNTLYIIGVHLESIRLTDNDKALYQEITDITKSSDNLNEQKVENVKSTLLSKLSTAFKRRAVQAKDLRQYIDSIGENVILCGDFNDTPSSFAYNTIMGDDMNDAYRECALGPTITFHQNRFYFRIDHVLYKGNFEATSIERGNIKSSDHYPLYATFRWKTASQK